MGTIGSKLLHRITTARDIEHTKHIGALRSSALVGGSVMKGSSFEEVLAKCGGFASPFKLSCVTERRV